MKKIAFVTLTLAGFATSLQAATLRPGNAAPVLTAAQDAQPAPTPTPTPGAQNFKRKGARVKKGSNFFGLPLLGLLAVGGAGAAVATSTDSRAPASPQ